MCLVTTVSYGQTWGREAPVIGATNNALHTYCTQVCSVGTFWVSDSITDTLHGHQECLVMLGTVIATIAIRQN